MRVRMHVCVCVCVCVWVGDGISTGSDDLIAGDLVFFTGSFINTQNNTVALYIDESTLSL